MADRQCVECRRVIKPGAPEFLVRTGWNRKKTLKLYFGPYGIACSLECAAKKDPVEWGEVLRA